MALFDADSGALVSDLIRPRGDLSEGVALCVAWLAGGRALAVAFNTGEARVYGVPSGKPLSTFFTGHALASCAVFEDAAGAGDDEQEGGHSPGEQEGGAPPAALVVRVRMAVCGFAGQAELVSFTCAIGDE